MPIDPEVENSSAKRRGGGLLFIVVVPFGVAFVVTVLVMIAAAFGDPESTMAEFLDRHGTTIVVVEALAVGVTAVVAMFADRMITVRRSGTPSPDETPPSDQEA